MPDKPDEFSIEIGADLMAEALQAVEKRLYNKKKKPPSESDEEAGEIDFGDIEIDFSEIDLSDIEFEEQESEAEEAADALREQLKKALQKNVALESQAADAQDESKRLSLKVNRLSEQTAQLKLDIRDGRENLKNWQDIVGRLKGAAQAFDDTQSNQRAKHKRELQKAGSTELAKSLKALLTPLDHIEMSFSHVDKNIQKDTPLHGLKMSVLELQTALEKINLVKIKALPGMLFDPERHEAIARLAHNDFETNQIVEIHRSGYRLGKRLLRAAQVSVSSGPEVAYNEE
jgi:molecular chaperone GrpE (heat shock protein)